MRQTARWRRCQVLMAGDEVKGDRDEVDKNWQRDLSSGRCHNGRRVDGDWRQWEEMAARIGLENWVGSLDLGVRVDSVE